MQPPKAPSGPSVAPALAGGRRAILAGVRELERARRPGVLAIVLQTSGSTYRKPGALVLLDGGGVRAGALSGGCLEAELEQLAREVLDEGCAREVRIDTSGDEDRVFGSGTGCGGSSRVLLVPLPIDGAPLRDALFAADARGLALELAFADAMPGEGEASVGGEVFRFDRAGGPRAADVGLDASLRVTAAAPRRLLLFGAGPETRPLLALLHLLDWQVELLEHRARWSRYAEAAGADHVHEQPPEYSSTLITARRFDAALAMYHNVALDARSLRQLAPAAIAYVGLLGPPARRDDLLREVGSEASAQLDGRLHAPVGLPLGGEGAESIALSIAAQLQQRFAGRAA
jgi:xanthine dehydrogenase accessory factor